MMNPVGWRRSDSCKSRGCRSSGGDCFRRTGEAARRFGVPLQLEIVEDLDTGAADDAEGRSDAADVKSAARDRLDCEAEAASNGAGNPTTTTDTPSPTYRRPRGHVDSDCDVRPVRMRRLCPPGTTATTSTFEASDTNRQKRRQPSWSDQSPWFVHVSVFSRADPVSRSYGRLRELAVRYARDQASDPTDGTTGRGFRFRAEPHDFNEIGGGR